MGIVKAKEIHHSDILKLESEMNNLWGELNTANIPHNSRLEIERELSECEENFKAVLGGEAPIQDLESRLHTCDRTLAMAAITQAENEISKTERMGGSFLALENIRHELTAGKLTPSRARHEVKDVIRHHR